MIDSYDKFHKFVRTYLRCVLYVWLQLLQTG
jgi:hypothetical protein